MIVSDIDFKTFKSVVEALELGRDDNGNYTIVSSRTVRDACPLHGCACIVMYSDIDLELIHLTCRAAMFNIPGVSEGAH